MDITKEQKKIFGIVGIVLVLFIIFLISIYLPAKSSVKILKAELLQIEGKISSIEAIIGKGRPLNKGLPILEQKLEELKKKFPDNEEETLRMISNIAHKFGLNVISIKPQPKNIFLDENESPATIDGCFCKEMPISMVLRSKYMELGKFLEALRESIPHLLTVESIKVEKSASYDELKSEINLTMYLLIEQRK